MHARSGRARGFMATAIVGALMAAGCGDDSAAKARSVAPAGSVDPAVDLRVVCPATVTVQTDWFPESEHGATFQLLGAGYQARKDRGSVTGPLTFRGKSTGVQLEIRGGGPLIGNQNVTSQLYQDDSILLGYVDTDEAIKLSKSNPTVSVVAPQDRSPMTIMWSAEDHPGITTIADIAKAVDTVSVFPGATFPDYLVASDLVPQSKLDRNYQGDKLLVAQGKSTAHQGFATSEPNQYSHLSTGPIKVAYQLVDDTGWRNYPEALAVKADKLRDTNTKACLKKLVPLFQQAQIDYATDPRMADDAIVATNKVYDSFWHYELADAQFSLREQLRLRVIANGVNNTLGDFDMTRVNDLIAKATPLFAKRGVSVKPDLRAEDIVTNEFIDPTITLPRPG
jgi:hypothetical protein